MNKYIVAGIIGAGLALSSCYGSENDGTIGIDYGSMEINDSSISKSVDVGERHRDVTWRIRPLDGETLDDVAQRLLLVVERQYQPYSFLTLLLEENGERLQLRCPGGELREEYGSGFTLEFKERYFARF